MRPSEEPPAWHELQFPLGATVDTLAPPGRLSVT